MNASELQKLLDDHILWLRGDAEGKRADLRGADLGDSVRHQESFEQRKAVP